MILNMTITTSHCVLIPMSKTLQPQPPQSPCEAVSGAVCLVLSVGVLLLVSLLSCHLQHTSLGVVGRCCCFCCHLVLCCVLFVYLVVVCRTRSEFVWLCLCIYCICLSLLLQCVCVCVRACVHACMCVCVHHIELLWCATELWTWFWFTASKFAHMCLCPDWCPSVSVLLNGEESPCSAAATFLPTQVLCCEACKCLYFILTLAQTFPNSNIINIFMYTYIFVM